jgi:ribosome recycling factor
MIESIKEELGVTMTKAIGSLQAQLAKVRTGRASAAVLDGIVVDYYGSPTPIKAVGQISTPEARLLQIQPFDKSLISEIEKSIINANLGLTPSNDGNFIRIQFPALTEDKRKDLVKQVKKMGEDSKVAIRNTRRDKNDTVKKAEKSKEISEDEVKKFLDEIQRVTDQYVKEVDALLVIKEKELLTV